MSLAGSRELIKVVNKGIESIFGFILSGERDRTNGSRYRLPGIRVVAKKMKGAGGSIDPWRK